MDTGKRSKRQRVWALWSGNTTTPAPKSSSTTDDIPKAAPPSIDQSARRLTRHASIPLSADTQLLPLSILPASSDNHNYPTMACNATITFSQAGVQPPVYVVTSLSDPPWETLEMHVDKEQTASDDLVFTRQFNKVVEGGYQYKIRIGEGHWVMDESKETAADEHGNRNNVIHVRSIQSSESTSSTSNVEQQEKPQSPQITHAKSSESNGSRKDNPVDVSGSSQSADNPVPLVVVEKVQDQEQPAYGDVEPSSLAVNEIKRAADPEPDLEKVVLEKAADETQSEPAEVPTLAIVKVDDKPAHGDDSGKNATITQQMAPETRVADTSPDQLVVAPDDDASPDIDGTELESAPLFRHETAHAHEPESLFTLESDYEGSDQHSSEQNGSKVDTTSQNRPLLPHDDESEEEEGYDELNHGPLLRHESAQNDHFGGAQEGLDELNATPLLSHEADFLELENSNHDVHGNGDYDYSSDDDHEEDEAPLLPHERASAVHSAPESDQGDRKSFSMQRQRSLDHDNENAKDIFDGRSLFRSRTNSSSLPHRLPRSDAEDDDLHDPSLERFPTDRVHILERVATIGLHLPEDQTLENTVHSPVMSVLSQACSSVDLVPVKSYASLASVPEDDNSDEDEADIESLPSPVVLNFPRSSCSVRRDSYKTSVMDQRKRSESKKSTEDRSAPTQKDGSSEKSGTVGSDTSKHNTLGMVQETLATATTTLNSMTPGLAPDVAETPTATQRDTPASQDRPRNRSVEKEDDLQESSTSKTAAPDSIGEHKVARAAIVVAGVAAAAWYFLGTA